MSNGIKATRSTISLITGRPAGGWASSAFIVVLLASSLFGQIDIIRAQFSPTVVPDTQTEPVLFEATVTGSPSSVVFNYLGTFRPMHDDGTNGDVTAGDSIWSITFTPQEILSRNSPNRVFRSVIGSCNITGFGALNVIAEVWTPEIGLRAVRPIDGSSQETDYIKLHRDA